MYKKITVIAASIIALCAISASAEFSDTENHWANNIINELAQQGVVHGFDDNTVRPDEPITVKDYVKLILAANYKNIDFSSEYWSGEIIDYAIYTGCISEGEFTNYNAYITRYDMMKITARSLGDTSDDYPEYLTSRGIITGDENGELNLYRNLTRAEAFTVIDRIIKSSEGIVEDETASEFNGIIELLPDTATLTGSKIKIEDNSPLNVGNFGMGDKASWTIEVPKSGTYRVSILQARNHEGEKHGEFIIDDSQKIEFMSKQTGNWTSYTEITLGEIELSEGVHSFCITSVNEDNFMNFRKIVLKDVELYTSDTSDEEVRVDVYPATAELIGKDIRLENGVLVNWKANNSAAFKFDLPETAMYEIELTYECDSDDYGIGMITFSDNKKRVFVTFKNNGAKSYNAGQFKLEAGENKFTIYPNVMSKTSELMRLKKISLVKKRSFN